jgi:hypothetical protein
MVYLVAAQFFNENQTLALAAFVMVILGGIGVIWTPLSLLIAHKLYQKLGRIEANQEKNGGKLDAINRNTGVRAEDVRLVETRSVPGLPRSNLARSDDEAADSA